MLLTPALQPSSSWGHGLSNVKLLLLAKKKSQNHVSKNDGQDTVQNMCADAASARDLPLLRTSERAV